MSQTVLTLPGEADLALHRLRSASGLEIAVLPTGGVYSITHRSERGENRINAYLGDPLGGGVGRVLVRRFDRDKELAVQEVVGPSVPRDSRFAVEGDSGIWNGKGVDLSYSVELWLDTQEPIWFWRVEVENTGAESGELDAVLVQDLGLGPGGFVSNNEAYASQYIDHTIVTENESLGRGGFSRRVPDTEQASGAHEPACGPVILSRQNLRQATGHPWCMTGGLDGTASWATDAMQVLGTGHRFHGSAVPLWQQNLPSERWQGESACPTVASHAVTLASGETAAWTFFGLFEPDHPAASGEQDLAQLDRVRAAAQRADSSRARVETKTGAGTARLAENARPPRSVFHRAGRLGPYESDEAALPHLFGSERRHVERDADGRLLSFFTPDGRHIVTALKEMQVLRRHGHILLAGPSVETGVPDEGVLSSTAWMHGVFASQLTLGNTNFHKLLSVSRSPLDLLPASGLRIFVRTREDAERAGSSRARSGAETGAETARLAEWALLGVPPVFEMSLSGCRWVYQHEGGLLIVSVQAAEDDAQLRLSVEVMDGEPVELLVVMRLVMGDRETDGGGEVTFDEEAGRIVVTPGGNALMAQRRPGLRYEIAADEASEVEAMGGDELLWEDGERRGTGHMAVQTRAVPRFGMTIRGQAGLERSDSPDESADLAESKANIDGGRIRTIASLKSGLEIKTAAGRLAALGEILPWMAHNATVHLVAPHGLEQYSGAAWGVRDVCQGPLEHLLAVGREEAARRIVLDVFAQQFDRRWDWPQWYMHEPYAHIRDLHAHGDVILWPLKALCDYLEATGDFDVLHEELPYREDGGELRPTQHTESLLHHVLRAVEAIRERLIPGTSLIRYGEGDWNDSLQPADPSLREWMTSAWTVALMVQTLGRWGEVLSHVEEPDASVEDSLSVGVRGIKALRDAVVADVRRHLMPGGQIAGYAIFQPDGEKPSEYLLHPEDTRTQITASLIPMTRSILAGLFTPEEAAHHLAIIRERLLAPDGARLMDRPVAYHGGLEETFRRAESAAYFGREVGLMYTHAHLRYAEAMAELGEAEALLEALLTINPIAVTQMLDHAAPRQRNAYFSSSDAAFADRYQSSAEYDRVRSGDVAVEGGWRVYSSGPGILIGLMVTRLLGLRRHYDKVIFDPVVTAELDGLRARLTLAGRAVTVRYEVREREHTPTRVTVNGRVIESLTQTSNPYRTGGLAMSVEAWRAATREGETNEVVVTL